MYHGKCPIPTEISSRQFNSRENLPQTIILNISTLKIESVKIEQISHGYFGKFSQCKISPENSNPPEIWQIFSGS